MKKKDKKDHADFTKQVNKLLKEQTHRRTAEELLSYRALIGDHVKQSDELARRLGKAHRRFTDIETIVFDILTTRVSKGKTVAKLMICPKHGILTPDLVDEDTDADSGGTREGTFHHRIAGQPLGDRLCHERVLNVRDPVRMFWKTLIDLAKRASDDERQPVAGFDVSSSVTEYEPEETRLRDEHGNSTPRTRAEMGIRPVRKRRRGA